MANSRSFLTLTADAAVFSVREYFRPILAAAQFFKSYTKRSTTPAAVMEEEKANLEEAKMILREGLAKRRRHEKLMLAQCTLSALASVLGAAISMLHEFQVENAFFPVVILLGSIFTLWVTFCIVKNREKIVEQKTVYRLMKALDRETAERVVKQITWPMPKKSSRLSRTKNTAR